MRVVIKIQRVDVDRHRRWRCWVKCNVVTSHWTGDGHTRDVAYWCDLPTRAAARRRAKAIRPAVERAAKILQQAADKLEEADL